MPELSNEQRADLATRVEAERIRRYGGNRKAAYTAAGVNSGTWTRIESGLRVREHTLTPVIALLWPATGGDWRQMRPPLGGVEGAATDLAAEVEASDLSPSTKSYILQQLADLTPPDPPPSDSQESNRGA